MKKNFDSIEAALKDIRQGKMVILVDDEDRENEGDLCFAAEKTTPEMINFMAKHGRGLICVSLTPEKVNQLGLPMMAGENTSKYGTNFTVSIEARHGVTTGISAADRCRTILTATKPDSESRDIAIPGHIFPLRAKKGGVLQRAGQTEGSVDLARLAGLNPSGVICEIMNDDGTMSRYDELKVFSEKHGIKIVTIADLIQYRLKTEIFIKKEAEANLPTSVAGEFKVMGFTNSLNNEHYVALVKGEWKPEEPVLVRVHSQCLTGDTFGSMRCDCGGQLHEAMRMVEKEGKGVILYLGQEGRGIGIINKLKAYHLQDSGADTVEANEKLGFAPDLRDYGFGAQVLVTMGLQNIKIITNNPRKIIGLEGYGITVTERVPIQVGVNSDNQGYLQTKKDKMGHILSFE